jgi:hypothetical protein
MICKISHRKIKDQATTNPVVNPGAPILLAVPAPHMTPVKIFKISYFI